jgi:hypothetical protein
VKCYISPVILPWICAINWRTWRHHSSMHRHSLQMAALGANKLLPILELPLQQRWYAVLQYLRVWRDWSSSWRIITGEISTSALESNSWLTGQEFRQISRNPKLYYHVQKVPAIWSSPIWSSNILWRVQITKLMQYLASRHFRPPPNVFPIALFLDTISLCSSVIVRNFHTNTKITRKNVVLYKYSCFLTANGWRKYSGHW